MRVSNLFDSRGLETLFLVLSSFSSSEFFPLAQQFDRWREIGVAFPRGEHVRRRRACVCVRVYTSETARWAPSGRARVIPLEFLEKRRPFATEIGESMIGFVMEKKKINERRRAFGWIRISSRIVGEERREREEKNWKLVYACDITGGDVT